MKRLMNFISRIKRKLYIAYGKYKPIKNATVYFCRKTIQLKMPQ